MPKSSPLDNPNRLLSLDALRGFDMFFIMGGHSFIYWLALLAAGALGTGGLADICQGIALNMDHVAWDGLTHHDTIFPLFLFIAGMAFPFSLDRQLEKGMTRGSIVGRVVRRGLLLVVLGVLYNGFLQLDWDNIRVASVLGRIGMAWMLGALIFIACGRRWLPVAIIVALILVGYWLLLAFVPAPDAPAGAGAFSMEGWLGGYVDRQWLPGHLYLTIHDPEGLLSTIPAISTALLGILAGNFVKVAQGGAHTSRKALVMFVVAIIMAIAGTVWGEVFPINKNMWTSSFVLVVGAYSLGMFALFYWVIDVLRCRRWTVPLLVIGLNSITIYMAQQFVSYSFSTDAIFGGLSSLCPSEAGAKALWWGGYVLLCWLSLYLLYRRRIFLKV